MLLSVRSNNFIFQVNFICQALFVKLTYIVVAGIQQLYLSGQHYSSSQLFCQVNLCCCQWDQTTLFDKSTLLVKSSYFVFFNIRQIKNFIWCRIFLCRGRQGRGGGGKDDELSVLEDFRAQRPHRVLQRPRHGLHVSTHVQSPKVIQQAKSPQTAQDSIPLSKKWFLTTAPPKLSCLSLSCVSWHPLLSFLRPLDTTSLSKSILHRRILSSPLLFLSHCSVFPVIFARRYIFILARR